jgi:hypothetical protein
MKAGLWKTVLKPPYRHLVVSDASAQRNVSIRLQSLCSAYLCPLRESAHEAPPLDSLPVLLWFFELPDFALEVIDAGVRNRQLTLKNFHFVTELLMLRIQVLQLLKVELHIL